MWNELNGNAERRVLSVVPNNSELRTYNSELGKAGDSELGEAVGSKHRTFPLVSRSFTAAGAVRA